MTNTKNTETLAAGTAVTVRGLRAEIVYATPATVDTGAGYRVKFDGWGEAYGNYSVSDVQVRL